MLVYLLPYMERTEVYDRIDLNKYYRDIDGQHRGLRRNIATFVCPSNPFAVYSTTWPA